MMKSASAPRRIYTRNGIVHVCFAGKYFAPTKDSTLSLDHPVTIEVAESDAKSKRAQVTVTQKRKGEAAIVETWRSVKVPRTPRAEATA